MTTYSNNCTFGDFQVAGAIEDSATFGTGNLVIDDTTTINGSANVTTPGSGNALQVTTGSIGTAGNLSIDGISNLDRTNIVTTDAGAGVVGFDVSGSSMVSIISSDATQASAIKIQASAGDSGIDIDSGSAGIAMDAAAGPISLDAGLASNFTVSSGDLSMIATASSVVVTAGEAVADAIKLTTASGGIILDSDGAGAAGGISVNATAPSNFTTTIGLLSLIAASGTDGQVLIQGGDDTVNAVKIFASDGDGGITMEAGTTGLDVNVTDGAITIDTVVSGGTGGIISIDSNVTGAAGSISNITHTSTGVGNDLLINVVSGNDSSVIIKSDGTGVDAVSLLSTGTGSIKLDATNAGSAIGGVDIDSRVTASSWTHTGTANGEGDLTIETVGAFDNKLIVTSDGTLSTALTLVSPTAGGGILIDATDNGTDVAGAVNIYSKEELSGWEHTVTGAAQDLTIGLVGVFDSSIIINSDGTGSDAISLQAISPNGGITAVSCVGGIDLDSQVGQTDTASGAVTIDTGAGGIGSTVVAGASGGITLTSGTGGAGQTTFGGGDAGDIVLTGGIGGAGGTSNPSGDGGTIQLVSNAAGADGTGGAGAAGNIEIDSAGLITGDAVSSIALNAGAVSNFTTSSGDLTLQSTNNSINITGGEAAFDAVRINASNAAGGIDIDAGSGGIDADTISGEDDSASGAISVSSGTGGIGSSSIGGASGSMTLESGDGGAGTVATFVGGASGDVLIQTGTGGLGQTTGDGGEGGAIDILAGTGGAGGGSGGDTGGAGGDVNIQPGDGGGGTSSGAIGSVLIGTTVSGAPISIGHTTSETTINGNATVSGDFTVDGTTTTVNTATLEIDDNVILINSAPGAISEDAGMIVRRYQQAQVGAASFDVTGDTEAGCVFTAIGSTGVGSGVTATLTGVDTVAYRIDQTGITQTFNGSQANFFTGWWVKVTTAGNLTAGATHRIKTSTAASTPLITIYDTADGGVDGIDFALTPNASVVFSIYSCPYVASVYNETEDEWHVAYTSTEPAVDGQITVQKFADLRVDNLIANTVNGVTPDAAVTVTLQKELASKANGVAIGGTTDSGSYIFVISSQESDGAVAVIAACSPSAAEDGVVNRMVHAQGVTFGERISVNWIGGENPKLYQVKAFSSTTGNVIYDVKVIST